MKLEALDGIINKPIKIQTIDGEDLFYLFSLNRNHYINNYNNSPFIPYLDKEVVEITTDDDNFIVIRLNINELIYD